jgi:predicted acyl esterase
VTSAVWYVQGYDDRGLAFTDDLAWSLLEKAPKRTLSGLWGHELPDRTGVNAQPVVKDFAEQLVSWFDFWLKGMGDSAPKLGIVEYQDGLRAWHTATAWPPREARDETLYFGANALAPAPDSGRRSFLSVPRSGPQGAWQGTAVAPQPYDPAVILCDVAGAPPTSLLYRSAPMDEETLVAGNPYAFLRITSDQPSGLVTLYLFDESPDFSCTGPVPHGARYFAFGAADLRFHAGIFQGRPFPTNTPTWIRIDPYGVQETLHAGHRLVAAFSYSEPTQRHTQPGFPRIEILGASEIVLPIVAGTVHGQAPQQVAPPRPFQPPGFPR